MAAVTLVHDVDIDRLDSPNTAEGPFRDAYIQEDAKDANHGDTGEMFAWRIVSGKDEYDWRGVVRFDLNTFIPADATITAAVWHFYLVQTSMNSNMRIHAKRTTNSGIVEDSVTWNKYDGVNNWSINHGQTTPDINMGYYTTTGWHTYDLRTLVDDAWDNRSGILAFILSRIDSEGSTTGGISIAPKTYPAYSSSCHHLRITYTLDGRTFQVVLR